MTRRAAVVVGVIVAALLAAVPASAVVVTTQNVRTRLDVTEARHDIRQAAERSSVVFAQEMKHRRPGRYAPAGWSSAQASRPLVGNRGDCATFWDRARWRLVRTYPVRISHAAFRWGHRWALVVVLASVARPRVRLATVNVHAFTRTMARPVAWRATVARLSRLAGTLVAQWGRVVMGGDWNRPWQLRARFPGFGTARPPRPTTAGGRIDYLYAHGFRFARVGVIGPTYSDHDGVRAWLRRV